MYCNDFEFAATSDQSNESGHKLGWCHTILSLITNERYEKTELKRQLP